MDKKHILVVDDDNRLRHLLHQYLNQNGFIVSEAENPLIARELMLNFHFDMLILDVMMPKENGFDFAKALRKDGIETPIMMLTAMGDVNNRIAGLECGVDDYLPKPFEPKELLLRISSIFRRTEQMHARQNINNLKLGRFSYDTEHKILSDGQKQVDLTPVENGLLYLFASHACQEISRTDIATQMQIQNERSIDVQVNRLRKKMEEDWRHPQYLRTARGKGYILLPD